MSQGGRKRAPKTVPVEQPEVLQELGEDGGAQNARDSETEPESREPTLADLTGLFRAHMAKMDTQEAQRNAEYAQQERRFKTLQHQFSLLQLEVQARTAPTPNPLLIARDTLDGSDEEDAVSSRLRSPSTTCRKEMSEVRNCSSLPVAKGRVGLPSDSPFDGRQHWRMCLWQHVRGISPGVGSPAGKIAD